jgi:hypothetical protein
VMAIMKMVSISGWTITDVSLISYLHTKLQQHLHCTWWDFFFMFRKVTKD